MRRDIYSNIGAVLALAPAVQSANINGVAIDTKGFGSVAIVLNTGAIVSAGDFSAKLQESDTTTSEDFTDVAAAQVQSNAPATLAASSTYKLGYLGNKRYCRVVLTNAGGMSFAAGAAAIKGHPHDAPVA